MSTYRYMHVHTRGLPVHTKQWVFVYTVAWGGVNGDQATATMVNSYNENGHNGNSQYKTVILSFLASVSGVLQFHRRQTLKMAQCKALDVDRE